MMVAHLGLMRLFAEMEMWRQRVLEQVNQEITGEDEEESILAGQANRFRHPSRSARWPA